MKVREARLEEISQNCGVAARADASPQEKIDPYFEMGKYAKERFAEFVREKIKNRNSRLLVATVDDKIVGYVLGWVKERPPVFKLKRIGYISDCFVANKFRGKGIGEKLTQRMLAWFGTKKLNHAELVVLSRNKLV